MVKWVGWLYYFRDFLSDMKFCLIWGIESRTGVNYVAILGQGVVKIWVLEIVFSGYGTAAQLGAGTASRCGISSLSYKRG